MLVPLAISLFDTTGLKTSISSAKKDGPSEEGPSFLRESRLEYRATQSKERPDQLSAR